MPRKGEKARKIKALKSGKGVKPPKRYWREILKETSKEYPELSRMRQAAISGARWSKISKAKKINIVRKYQT